MSNYLSAAPFPEGMDIVFLDGLTTKTVIGIKKHELYDPQSIRVNIAIGIRQNQACQTDQIKDTINYSDVRRAVKLLVVHHRFKLLERFTEAIAQLILNDFNADWVRVSVAKTAIYDDVEAVGMMIERKKKPTNTDEN